MTAGEKEAIAKEEIEKKISEAIKKLRPIREVVIKYYRDVDLSADIEDVIETLREAERGIKKLLRGKLGEVV